MQEPRTLFYKSCSDSQEHFVELVMKNLFVIHMEDFFGGLLLNGSIHFQTGRS